MNEIRVRFVCGCQVVVNGDEAPRCVEHDEPRIQSVTAPPPRIRAVNCQAEGSHVIHTHG